MISVKHEAQAKGPSCAYAQGSEWLEALSMFCLNLFLQYICLEFVWLNCAESACGCHLATWRAQLVMAGRACHSRGSVPSPRATTTAHQTVLATLCHLARLICEGQSAADSCDTWRERPLPNTGLPITAIWQSSSDQVHQAWLLSMQPKQCIKLQRMRRPCFVWMRQAKEWWT